jgi:hypothetical protein
MGTLVSACSLKGAESDAESQGSNSNGPGRRGRGVVRAAATPRRDWVRVFHTDGGVIDERVLVVMAVVALFARLQSRMICTCRVARRSHVEFPALEIPITGGTTTTTSSGRVDQSVGEPYANANQWERGTTSTKAAKASCTWTTKTSSR